MSACRAQPRPRLRSSQPAYPTCLAIAAALVLGACSSDDAAPVSSGGDIAVPFDATDGDAVESAAETSVDSATEAAESDGGSD